MLEIYENNFKKAFEKVSMLVKDFKANKNLNLSYSYSKADMRNDFINKENEIKKSSTQSII